MTFLLSEDKALREKLQGIVVHDQKSDATSTPRQVGVFFGQPDQEIRAQVYPYITIDLIDINRDMEREMRGKTNASYLVPDGMTINAGEFFETDLPIPVSLDYQVTAYSRNPVHDRTLMAQLLQSKLPFRFGYLELDDNTIRRLDITDVSKRDMTEAGKRLFMNAVTVRVSSEIPQETYRKIIGVQQAVIRVTTTPDGPSQITETFTITE
jgi:hypothetical protein